MSPVELRTEHLVFMNIGERYWKADLADATEVQRSALRSYVRQFKKMIRDGVGLYLCGPNGTGKTFLSAALLKEAWRRWGIGGYCVIASDLKEAWIKDREAHRGSEETIVARTEAIRILVIDDLGKEHRAASGFAETQFGALLRSRSRRKLVTILTTNLTPQEFADIYGASSAKLLKECVLPVMLKGPDERETEAEKLRRRLR